MDKLYSGKRAYSVFLLCATTAIALQAQTFTTLQSFDLTHGADPYAGLVQATDGKLYGTTVDGGANNYGTVFRITPSGTLTTLYSFCSKGGCSDGAYLYAGLVQATDGNFYGTTSAGGATNHGTVFKITPSGTLTTLHSFDLTDGADPVCGAGPGHRWELLRDNVQGRGPHLRHGLQNHPKWHADDAAQLLLAKRLHGRHLPRGTGPGHQWNFYGTTSAGGATAIMGRSSKSPQVAR